MNHSINRILLILACFLAGAGALFGATELTVIAPGETFTVGAGKGGADTTRVSGVPFHVTVYSVDDGTWTFVNTLAGVQMSSADASFTPSSFTLDETEPGTSTPNSMKVVEVTIAEGTANGNVLIGANNVPNSGIEWGSVTLTTQKINAFDIQAISSPRTAGNPIAYNITAEDIVSATVTGFNGTANLIARYENSGDLVTQQIQFINGVATGTITLYDASNGESVELVCESSTPSVTSSSNSFDVDPGAFTQLYIIGPGITFNPGNTTSGRSSAVLSERTAGEAFSTTVYACDAYYNTVPSASGTVDISSSDSAAGFTPSASVALSNGAATFGVTLEAVGGGSQTISADLQGGGASPDTVTAPITHDDIDHFGFISNISASTAGTWIFVSPVAQDAYGNTVTDFTTTTSSAATVSVLVGGGAIDSNHYQASANVIFSAGYGAFAVRVYQRSFNTVVRVNYDGATGDTNSFNVNPGSYSKLLLIAPGEVHDPGNASTGGKLTNTASTVTVGSSVPVAVYATDQYGNRITTISDDAVVTSSDTAALIDGSAQPVTISVNSGIGSFNVIFQSVGGGTQSVTADPEQGGITNGSTTIPVTSATLDHFEFSSVSGALTAGQTDSIIISAVDQYNNVISTWSGDVWVTSPDTDWLNFPYESTIGLSGTSVELVGHRWHITFTAGTGQETLTLEMRRAATGAQLFASDVEDDTPSLNTGHIGQSSAINITADSMVKMQVIPPGITPRPGTSDGETDGPPTGQSVGLPFYVTVSAVDDWFNIVDTTGEVKLSSNDPTQTEVNGSVPGNPPSGGVSGFLVNGSVIMMVEYFQSTTAFWLIADHTTGGIVQDSSQNINVFNVRKFKIEAPGGGNIGEQKVGVPFPVSITAWQDDFASVPASGFTGTIQLKASNDYSDSEYCIEPTEVSFTAGVCVTNVTMYRAETTRTGVGASINAIISSVESKSNDFSLWWDDPSNVMVLIDGMEHKPGLTHVGIPGYKGYEGSPKTVEAGQAFQLEVYYVDDYYNRNGDIWTYCKMTSTDGQSDIEGVPLNTDNVYVTITAGAYPAVPFANATLRTVGDSGQQYITAEPGGSLPNNTSPPINIRHTTIDHLRVDAPAGPITAGVPFNITIVALDAYSNTLDAINGGTPFNSSIDLQAATGDNTMWPEDYTLSSGVGIASVQLFKAAPPFLITQITGSYAGVTFTCEGTSSNIQTISNEFERLLIISSGMTRENGWFSGSTPNNFPMYSGSPSFSGGSNLVNDGEPGGGPGGGYQFVVYSCDAYGNVTPTGDVIGQTVNVMTSDEYAYPVTPTAIDSVTGQVIINGIFRTAMQGVSLTATINNSSIADFTTPTFTTYAGAPYGMQIIVPGYERVSGAGYYDFGDSKWYNAVTVTNQVPSVPVGVTFSVTVNACDKFGNSVSSSTNHISVTSTDADGNAYPGGGGDHVGYLGDVDAASLTLSARLYTQGYMIIQSDDLDNALDRNMKSWPRIQITDPDDLDYYVRISNDGNTYTVYFDGSEEIAVTAGRPFYMDVWVVDPAANPKLPIWGVNKDFRLDAMVYDNTSQDAVGDVALPVGGQGTVVNGSWTTSSQQHNIAEGIRIRVRDILAALPDRYSCAIHVSANARSVDVGELGGIVLTANPAGIGSYQYTTITARVVDIYGNSVTGRTVDFDILTGQSTGDGVFALPGNITSTTGTATTDSAGNANIVFLGSAQNGICVIRGTYNYYDWSNNYTTVTNTADVMISLVDPGVEGGISNYPNPFRAGSENTKISFYLDQAKTVSLKIYNLFGDLVLERDYEDTDMQALINTQGNMVTVQWDGINDKGDVVGNGGYICVIVPEGEEKRVRKIAVRK